MSGRRGGPVGTGAIESRSIDWVPEHERHGKVGDQGPFWFLGNFQPFTVGIGLTGPTVLGLPLGATVIACVVGVLFGTLFMAFHASQGPTFGLPQMIQSRAQFGHRGVVLALIATSFTFVVFNVVDTVIIKVGLHHIFGWGTTPVAVTIGLAAAALAVYGHDWLHRAFQGLFWLSVPFWVVLTLGVLAGHAGATPGDVPEVVPGATTDAGMASAALAFTWPDFLAMFSIAASYNITYAPYVSDYTRYLPRHTPVRAIVGSVFVGAVGSPIWLMPLGAWMGARLGVTDPLVGIHRAGNAVLGGLGDVLVVLSVLALVATMGLNAYSGMLTVVTGLDSLRPFHPGRRTRVVVIVALTSLWLALAGPLDDAGQTLNNALLIMLYLLAPWTAVNLVDFFFVRRGHYAITDLFTPHGVYGSWGRRGIVALVVGTLVEVPFMVLGGEGAYVGPLARLLHDVDASWLVGMLVAGGLYLYRARDLDHDAEHRAREHSDRRLLETS